MTIHLFLYTIQFYLNMLSNTSATHRCVCSLEQNLSMSMAHSFEPCHQDKHKSRDLQGETLIIYNQRNVNQHNMKLLKNIATVLACILAYVLPSVLPSVLASVLSFMRILNNGINAVRPMATRDTRQWMNFHTT